MVAGLSGEGIGRSPNRHAEGEAPLPGPGIEPISIEADRQVSDQERPGGGCCGQLLVDQPLDPLVEGDPVRAFGSSSGHGR